MVHSNDKYQYCNQPNFVYNEFRKLVCSLSNDAMYPSSSSWRDSYYTTDLDEVLSIFYESQKKQPLVNTLVAEENHFRGKVNSDEQRYESPIFVNSGQSDRSLDSPATTLTCSTFIGSPDSDNYNTVFSPNSTPSSSPVELPSPTSNTSLHCDICNESFNGKKEDQRSNLKRHIRSVHESNFVPCPEPGCNKMFAGRRDNMDRHRRKHHEFVLNPDSASLVEKEASDARS